MMFVASTVVKRFKGLNILKKGDGPPNRTVNGLPVSPGVINMEHFKCTLYASLENWKR